MNFRTILGLALGLVLLYGLFTVGSPFLLAMIIAIFLEPLVLFSMRIFRMGRIAAATLISTLFTLLMLFFTYLLGAKLFTELVEFTKKAPGYLSDANRYIQDAMNKKELFYNSLPAESAEQAKVWLENGATSITDALSGVLRGLYGYFINVAKLIPNMFIWSIVFIVALYLLSMGMPGLKKSFLTLFDEKSREKVSTVLDNLRSAIFGFIQAQIILSVIVYVMSLLGFLILGIDYPMALALLVVIVDVLPVLGVGSALIPWAVYNLIAGSTYIGAGLVVMFVVITVVRRIVEPKVVGDAVGIGALSALISLYVGFKLVGVVGLFLGPIVVIIYQAMRKVGLLQTKIKLE